MADSGLSASAKAGLGAGIGVGIPVLVGLGVAIGLLMRRNRNKKDSVSEPLYAPPLNPNTPGTAPMGQYPAEGFYKPSQKPDQQVYRPVHEAPTDHHLPSELGGSQGVYELPQDHPHQ